MRASGASEEALAVRFKDLEPVQLLEGTEYVRRYFGALHRSRAQGMSGPLAITHTEIEAFTRLKGIQLAQWELEAIEEMDCAYIEESYKKQE
jgi:hypothetical protein